MARSYSSQPDGLVWQARFNGVPWSREQQNAHELRINYSVVVETLAWRILCRWPPAMQEAHFSAPPEGMTILGLDGVMVIFLLTIEWNCDWNINQDWILCFLKHSSIMWLFYVLAYMEETSEGGHLLPTTQKDRPYQCNPHQKLRATERETNEMKSSWTSRYCIEGGLE